MKLPSSFPDTRTAQHLLQLYQWNIGWTRSETKKIHDKSSIHSFWTFLLLVCLSTCSESSSEFSLNVLLPYDSIFAFKKSSSVWTDTVGVGNPIHSRAHLKKEKQAANMFQRDKKGKGTRDRAAVATFLAIRWWRGLCWDCSVHTSDSNMLRILQNVV